MFTDVKIRRPLNYIQVKRSRPFECTTFFWNDFGIKPETPCIRVVESVGLRRT